MTTDPYDPHRRIRLADIETVAADAEGLDTSSVGSVGSVGSTLPALSTLPTRAATTEYPVAEEEAFHGLAGYWAEAMAPYSEASRIGIVASTLVAFGAAAGRTPYVQVGGTPHYGNEFVILVGPTATGRKNEAIRIGLRPLRLADADWAATQIMRGFGSGESLIEAVSDEKDDRRLLVHEDEFAMPLNVAARKGSTLSGLLRSAWDGSRLENRTRGSGVMVASEAHVSVLTGITPDELVRLVARSEIANGFLNRFLIVAVKRPGLLPNPPPIPGNVEAEYVTAFRGALTFARQCGTGFARSPDAAAFWDEAYRSELSVDRAGLAGAACSRAEAHTLRLSLLYALLDRSRVIEQAHVEAALAFWRYAEQSARALFGERLGDPVADDLLGALREVGARGLTRSQVRDHFSRHIEQSVLDEAIDRLITAKLVTKAQVPTAGRSATVYCARPDLWRMEGD